MPVIVTSLRKCILYSLVVTAAEFAEFDLVLLLGLQLELLFDLLSYLVGFLLPSLQVTLHIPDCANEDHYYVDDGHEAY